MAETRVTQKGMDAVRVTAFTDGLFVVAATLLVVSIDIPNIPDNLVAAQLPGVLEDLVPQLFSYFISFAVIAVFWFRHHALFGRIVHYDTGFVVLNFVFLAFIAILPFPTELQGKYGDETISVVIYAINVLILSGMLTVLFTYSERKGLVHPDAEPSRVVDKIRGASVFIVFGLSIPIALLFGARAGQYTWLSLFVIARLSVLYDRRRRPAAS
jgi:uncharacterized membrane protein